MKKLKINLVMIAVVLGAAGAIATKAAHFNPKPATNLYWFHYDAAGQIIPQATAPSLGSDPFGCPGGTVNCASGYAAYTTNGSGQYVPSGSASATDLRVR